MKKLIAGLVVIFTISTVSMAFADHRFRDHRRAYNYNAPIVIKIFPYYGRTIKVFFDDYRRGYYKGYEVIKYKPYRRDRWIKKRLHRKRHRIWERRHRHYPFWFDY